MLLYSSSITSRLKYAGNFISNEILVEPFELTTDKNYYQGYQGAKINYSAERIADNEFRIKPHTLLFENNISQQSIQSFNVNRHKAFFKTEGDFPYDIFAASFYLLSRYEEWLPHQKDMYGRFAHENSLAFRENFLEIPLINYWLKDFKESLNKFFNSLTPIPFSNLTTQHSPLSTHHSPFTFLPTYDIDIAWSYKNKGWGRTVGGLMQSLIKGNWQQLKERVNVLQEKQPDPFDSYGWLDQLHEKYKLKAHYFFLMAEKIGKYDKNISPRQKALQQLIADHLKNYPVGIHPSWQSGDDPSLLKKEMDSLQAITGSRVLSSRQHYIRFTLPETYRGLIENGIQSDYSMGYGSINGFRASVASPFFWYDLEKEMQTELMLYPFCYMEANSFFEQRLSPLQAFDEMRHYYQVIKQVNGTFIMIWHNHFLGTDKLYKGWKEVYEQFIMEVGK